MRKIVALSITILLIVSMLSACDKGAEVSPEDKSILELATKIYTDDELVSCVQFEGTLDEQNERYPIECIRKTNGGYRVSYRGNDCYAVISFDDSKVKTFGGVYPATVYKDELYDTLYVGQSLCDVKRFDPDGYYEFEHTGLGYFKDYLPSYHYTFDGYVIIIEYSLVCDKEDVTGDKDFVISDFKALLI